MDLAIRFVGLVHHRGIDISSFHFLQGIMEAAKHVTKQSSSPQIILSKYPNSPSHPFSQLNHRRERHVFLRTSAGSEISSFPFQIPILSVGRDIIFLLPSTVHVPKAYPPQISRALHTTLNHNLKLLDSGAIALLDPVLHPANMAQYVPATRALFTAYLACTSIMLTLGASQFQCLTCATRTSKAEAL